MKSKLNMHKYIVYFLLALSSCHKNNSVINQDGGTDEVIRKLTSINSSHSTFMSAELLSKLTVDNEWVKNVKYIPTSIKIYGQSDEDSNLSKDHLEIKISLLWVGDKKTIEVLDKKWILYVGDEKMLSSDVVITESNLGSGLSNEMLTFIDIVFTADKVSNSFSDINSQVSIVNNSNISSWILVGEIARGSRPGSKFIEKYLKTRSAFIAEKQKFYEVHYGIQQPLNLTYEFQKK